MRSLPSLAIVPVLALVGCYPFISGGRFDEQVCTLDEDGDGNLKCTHDDGTPGDCDDNDAGKFHGNTEVPYDGIDNDCVDGDIVDADNDRYAGISQAEYEAKGGEPWPSGLQPGVDCNDDDASINPGATEIWYNGIDEDCGEDCDYDQDGDEFADARQGAGNDCDLPATDCLDIRDDIFPGAPGEVYYDGEDQDCDQVNDFDPDGDGDAWDGYQDENSTFLTRYGYDDTIDAYVECYDIDDGNLPETGPVDPSTVNTKATEVFRDGIDGDCGDLDGTVENDFDGDADGFMVTADRAAFLAYVQRYNDYTKHDGTQPYKAAFAAAFGPTSVAWQAYFDARDNDCDDTDPSVYPGALETLGDSIDQDCDGGVDTTPFVFGDLEFDGLGNPELASTGDRFVLLVNATGDADFGSGSEGPKVAAMSFGIDATGDETPNKDNTPYAVPSGDTLSPALGVAGFSGGYFTAFGWERSGQTRVRATLSTAGSSSSSEFSVDDEADGARITSSVPWPHTDLACDGASSTCWAVACGSQGMQFLEFRDGDTSTTFEAVQSGFADVPSTDCFVVPEELSGNLLLVSVASDGSSAAYESLGSGSIGLAPVNPFGARSINNAQTHDNVVVAGLVSTGVLLWQSSEEQSVVLSGTATQYADAAFADSTAYVVAVRRGGTGIHFAYGTPGSSMTEVALPFAREGSSLDPVSVAIEVDGSRVAVAAVSSSDDLGWLFFEI